MIGKNALHVACENGHMDCAELLLEHKAFANAKTKLGLSPVSLAAAQGGFDCIFLFYMKLFSNFDNKTT